MSKLTDAVILDEFVNFNLNPANYKLLECVRAIESLVLQESAKRIAELEKQVSHWKANHDHMQERCAWLSQRTDLPVDRIPAYESAQRRIAKLESEVTRLKAACDKYSEDEILRGTFCG